VARVARVLVLGLGLIASRTTPGLRPACIGFNYAVHQVDGAHVGCVCKHILWCVCKHPLDFWPLEVVEVVHLKVHPASLDFLLAPCSVRNTRGNSMSYGSMLYNVLPLALLLLALLSPSPLAHSNIHHQQPQTISIQPLRHEAYKSYNAISFVNLDSATHDSGYPLA
jgi:hypothetical protein